MQSDTYYKYKKVDGGLKYAKISGERKLMMILRADREDPGRLGTLHAPGDRFILPAALEPRSCQLQSIYKLT